MPERGLSLTAFQARSGIVVRARKPHRLRADAPHAARPPQPAASAPMLGCPRCELTSHRLIVFDRDGTPSKGESGFPAAQRRWLARAVSRARSPSMTRKGLSRCCTMSARARIASRSSTGDRVRPPYRRQAR